MRTLAAEIDALTPSLIAWRRELHRHPELAFEEHRTSSFLRTVLEAEGIEVRSCGGTGLVGRLRGGRAGRTVALRADMDALPVAELTGHGFPSENPGVMHACGHDGHMAILLGAARILAARRAELAGDVVFLLQPAEERPPGGALRMIEEGALEGVDAIFGLHLWQPLASGLVGLRAGPMMAQSDLFSVAVRGRGGHASQPQGAIDPVVAAAHLVMAAQTIVSRSVDPVDAAVVSFTTIHGGHIHNVIPDEVALQGTVRTFDPAVQSLVRRRLEEIAEATGRLFGATVPLSYTEGYPTLVNDPDVIALARRVASREFGPGRVAELPPILGGEDFAYYLQRVPGAFVMLGIGTDRPFPHHNARFDLDEDVLPDGVRLMVSMALALAE